jgi:UDPglucose 6-dehydrogenase
MKSISVVGTGYVGLVSGACLADLGNDVTCLDIATDKIARLRAGDLPIYEPGLEAIVHRNVAADRIRFTTSYAEALAGAEFIFIAVDTPMGANGAADMSSVEAAARAIAEHLAGDVVIVNKSTMPVGSGDLVSAIVREHQRDAAHAVAVVSNPEFLREGNAVHDFLHPDRIVLGSTARAAAEAVAQLYLPLRAPIMLTDLYTAEMIKYASNAFLATKVSFINEIARICERLGADVSEVAEGMGYDKRIGRAFLNAGLGYGGSCLPKDVKALAHMAAESGLHPQLLDAVVTINADQRRLVVAKLEAALGGSRSLRSATIAVLGLAFKDQTDDMRAAPALDVIDELLAAGTRVRVYDPVAMQTARRMRPEWPITYCADAYEAARGSAGVVVVTEWREFRELDLERLCAAMDDGTDGPVMVDGRNLLNPEAAALAGLRYFGIGRGAQRVGPWDPSTAGWPRRAAPERGEASTDRISKPASGLR